MSNIFIYDISINYLKYNFYEFLNLYCIKDKSNFILFNKEIYKKYEYNNKIKDFVDFIKNHYKKSKKYFVERTINYNNFTSILRHLCKLLIIPYYKKIIYNKNSYFIEYYIKKECL
jgi:hypothetical protein